MHSLVVEPLIPAALWLTLALAAGTLLAWYALHRPSAVSKARWTAIIMLMGTGLGMVLLVLLNPTWVRPLPSPPGKPLLTVLVDTSASMATPDSTDGRHRFDAASKSAAQIVQKLSNRFDVRIRTFAAAAQPADPSQLGTQEPQGKSTDLAGAITASLDQDRPQGQAIALLSDGIHNSDGAGRPGAGAARVLDAVRVAKAMSAPIYTGTFGGDVSGWDVAVELASAQDVVVVGQKLPLTVRIKYNGGLSPAACQLVLLRDGKEVDRQQAKLRPSEPFMDMSFVISQDKTGLYSYEVRAEPVPGETSQANNVASYLLRVVDEPIRVLVVEGKPYWDSKFFLRTLATDPAVALDSVVQVAPNRLVRRTLSRQEARADTPNFAGAVASADGAVAPSALAERQLVESFKVLNDPASVLSDADSLRAFQIIVIGRDAEPFLTDSAIASLQTWISRQGGSLVCYRGSPTSQVNQKLARLLPVKWNPTPESRFRMALTDEGRDLRWTLGSAGNSAGDQVLGQLPTLSSAQRIVDSKPLAVSLAVSVWPQGGEPAPAVVYQPYGSGRAIVIEGSGMWRWAFLPPKYQDHEQVYASMWHSLLHWLTSGVGLLPGQNVSLRTDKVTFGTDEPASVTLLVREEKGALLKPPQVQLTADGSEQPRAFTPVPLGEETGVYRVNFETLPEGRYKAQVVGAGEEDASTRVLFDVRSYGEEQLNLQARPDLMARIAADSGGAVIRGNAPDEIQHAFKEHMRRTRPPIVERTTAWDHWWLLVALLGCWSAAWALRRAGGLV